MDAGWKPALRPFQNVFESVFLKQCTPTLTTAQGHFDAVCNFAMPDATILTELDLKSPAIDAASRRRILVVESDSAVANDLTRLMSDLGHETLLSADAKSALFGLIEFEPHLVLLGTYLADMPGYELSSILRGAPQYAHRFRHVGLLYVADRNKLLKHRFIGAPEVPISQYIFKPLDSSEVREKVARALRASIVG